MVQHRQYQSSLSGRTGKEGRDSMEGREGRALEGEWKGYGKPFGRTIERIMKEKDMESGKG